MSWRLRVGPQTIGYSELVLILSFKGDQIDCVTYRSNMIMNRKMKSTVGVCLLFLVLLEAMCCEGCWKEERDALLVLHSRFDFPLSNWDGPDCCQWEGVECNSTTGRVAQLFWSLLWQNPKGHEVYLNYSDFVVFKDLKNLYLPSTSISGCVGNEG